MQAVRRTGAGYACSVPQERQSAAERCWLRRTGTAAVDDAGSVLLAWRTAVGRTQVEVAEVLGTTQQHLSQIETGQRPVSLELRRMMVTELGIATEELGLSSGYARTLVSRDDASPQIAASRLRWRDERRWLNQHRAELGALVVQLCPTEYRLPHTTVIAPPEWLSSELWSWGRWRCALTRGHRRPRWTGRNRSLRRPDRCVLSGCGSSATPRQSSI